VYRGTKEGNAAEVAIETDSEIFKFFGLIDYDCHRVYAIKVVATTSSSSSITFAELPLYGHVGEVHPNGKVAVPVVPQGYASATRDLTPYAGKDVAFPKLRSAVLTPPPPPPSSYRRRC